MPSLADSQGLSAGPSAGGMGTIMKVATMATTNVPASIP